MGTPDFSVPCLHALVEAGHDVTLVVTQPDRPRGRGRRLEPTPVKAAALARGLEIFQPDRPNRPENVAAIAAARPEVLVVVAYGAILKEALLTLAPRGAINVHASLLPRYRGMSPIQRAIWNGDRETGVTTMFMDAGVDTGDMILRCPTHVGPDETAGELHDRLALLGARLLVDTLARLADGTAPRLPQTGEASYAPRIEKKDGVIDWTRPASAVHNHVRAVTPWPGAQAFCRGEALLLIRTRRVTANDAAATGAAEAAPPRARNGSRRGRRRVAAGLRRRSPRPGPGPAGRSRHHVRRRVRPRPAASSGRSFRRRASRGEPVNRPPGKAMRGRRGRREPIPRTPREVALEALYAVDRRHAFSDRLLHKLLRDHPLEARDAALVTSIVRGTLRWRGRIDAHSGPLHQDRARRAAAHDPEHPPDGRLPARSTSTASRPGRGGRERQAGPQVRPPRHGRPRQRGAPQDRRRKRTICPSRAGR